MPHTIKSYRDDSWKKFYVFDVAYDEGEENYLSYETYIELLEKYNIDYIPAICKIKNPTTEKLIEREEKVKVERAAAEKRGHDVPRHAAQLETQPLPAPEQQKPAQQQQQQQQQQ